MTAVEQLFECTYDRVIRVFHNLHYCPKRFLEVCCFVIAVAHRCSYSSPLLSSLRSELESNALSLSLSPLCNHFLSHPASLDMSRLFPSAEPGSTLFLWLSVEQHVENGHYSEAVAVLLQLLQSAEHQSLFILYDLILLSMKHNTETILPLQRLLLTQLESTSQPSLLNAVPFLRPASLPPWTVSSITNWKSFFLQQMALVTLTIDQGDSLLTELLSKMEPSVLFLAIRGFLQVPSANEDFHYLENAFDPFLTWIKW